MQTTYYLNSAQELNVDILESIKAAFKTNAITIVVADDIQDDNELSEDMKFILNDRLNEDETKYLSAKESIERLNQKYGL